MRTAIPRRWGSRVGERDVRRARSVVEGSGRVLVSGRRAVRTPRVARPDVRLQRADRAGPEDSPATPSSLSPTRSRDTGLVRRELVLHAGRGITRRAGRPRQPPTVAAEGLPYASRRRSFDAIQKRIDPEPPKTPMSAPALMTHPSPAWTTPLPAGSRAGRAASARPTDSFEPPILRIPGSLGSPRTIRNPCDPPSHPTGSRGGTRRRPAPSLPFRVAALHPRTWTLVLGLRAVVGRVEPEP